MEATALLVEIYESKDVAACIKKLRPVHLQEDIKQHTFLTMFEKPKEEIIELNNRGKLKAYIVKILHNTATYHRTSFTKCEGQERNIQIPTDFCQHAEYNLIKVDTDNEDHREAIEQVACATSKMHWYKVQVLKEYAELGTYKAVSDKTKIPLTSIYNTVKEARKEIKQRL